MLEVTGRVQGCELVPEHKCCVIAKDFNENLIKIDAPKMQA